MGTQFWWFYDAVILCIAGTSLYSAISRGFNKIVFSLIGFLAAVGIGIGVSAILSGSVYEMLYHEKITSTAQTLLSEWDMYSGLSDAYREFPQENEEMAEDCPEEMDAQQLQNEAVRIASGETAPEWFLLLTAQQTQKLLEAKLPAHSPETLAQCFENDPPRFEEFLNSMNTGNPEDAAGVLEALWYRPSYERMVRMALFLLLELAVMIVAGIISAAAGNLEELMHIRKFNRLLAVPVGLVKGAVWLLTFCVMVKLLICISDGQMLLFNEETIAETMLFHYIYPYI